MKFVYSIFSKAFWFVIWLAWIKSFKCIHITKEAHGIFMMWKNDWKCWEGEWKRMKTCSKALQFNRLENDFCLFAVSSIIVTYRWLRKQCAARHWYFSIKNNFELDFTSTHQEIRFMLHYSVHHLTVCNSRTDIGMRCRVLYRCKIKIQQHYEKERLLLQVWSHSHPTNKAKKHLISENGIQRLQKWFE